jgi:hypothetical protein
MVHGRLAADSQTGKVFGRQDNSAMDSGSLRVSGHGIKKTVLFCSNANVKGTPRRTENLLFEKIGRANLRSQTPQRGNELSILLHSLPA